MHLVMAGCPNGLKPLSEKSSHHHISSKQVLRPSAGLFFISSCVIVLDFSKIKNLRIVLVDSLKFRCLCKVGISKKKPPTQEEPTIPWHMETSDLQTALVVLEVKKQGIAQAPLPQLIIYLAAVEPKCVY